MSSRLAVAAFATTLLAGPALAAAHIQLINPVPRSLEQKAQHCGPLNSTRGANVTVLEPGAMLEVRWNETINHPGHYRISLDIDGQDFTIPPTANGTTMGMPNVVMDLIADRSTTPGNNAYSQMIQLPNMTCENCTLQVIQLMTDKPPYTTDALSDDIYFQCADIALRRPGGGVDAGIDAAVSIDAAVGPDAGNGVENVEGGCGCRTSQTQPTGIAFMALVLGVATRRRRRD
jgi:MYXO-CTERM domain-containing protein